MNNDHIILRPATVQDADAWLQLRCDLWPDTTEAEHRVEIEAFFNKTALEPLSVLFAVDPESRLVGFVELSIRPYAEGCDSQRVAYVEGWYVVADWRDQGVGRSLIQASEHWGRSQGCTELASDTEADNELSRQAHCAIGFEEVGLVRCFRKDL